MAATPTGETVAAPSNGTPAPVTPPTDTSGASEVEKMKAELQQQMRANQLAKEELKKLTDEKEARDKVDSDARAKKLEEDNQFKELYEQEKTKRETIEAERQDMERKSELNKAKSELLADYSDEVKTLAEEVGLDLSSDDDTAKTEFKEKLDKINQSVVASGKITGNNPRQQTGEAELSTDELREALQNDDKFHEIVTKRFPGIAAMTGPRKVS